MSSLDGRGYVYRVDSEFDQKHFLGRLCIQQLPQWLSAHQTGHECVQQDAKDPENSNEMSKREINNLEG
jgi:hypothetical protein